MALFAALVLALVGELKRLLAARPNAPDAMIEVRQPYGYASGVLLTSSMASAIVAETVLSPTP